MRKPKFKVGDKVKVLRASTNSEERLWCDCWCSPDMDGMIGKEYAIGHVRLYGNYEYPSYDLQDGWRLPEFVLQSDIKVGQQLIFEFMEEQS